LAEVGLMVGQLIAQEYYLEVAELLGEERRHQDRLLVVSL
jgi:hypothetical protein